MRFDLEAFADKCNVSILIVPEDKDADLGKVVSSILRLSSANVDYSAMLNNAPLSVRIILGSVKDAYGGSLSFNNLHFEGFVLIGDKGDVVVSGRLNPCGESQVAPIVEFVNKLMETLMRVYGNIIGSINIYSLAGRLEIEVSTTPK